MVIDFSNLYDFPRYLDQLLESGWRPGAAPRRPAGPPLNISEDDASYLVRAELPGVDIADIELTLAEKSLVLRGERKAPEGRFVRQERPAGPFQRIVTLNAPVRRDAVTATMKDGVLTVTLPKADAAGARKIQIVQA